MHVRMCMHVCVSCVWVVYAGGVYEVHMYIFACVHAVVSMFKEVNSYARS